MFDGQCGGDRFSNIGSEKKEIYQALQGHNQNSAIGGIREVFNRIYYLWEMSNSVISGVPDHCMPAFFNLQYHLLSDTEL